VAAGVTSILLTPEALRGIAPDSRKGSICAATGGYIVAPPSIHPSGRPYTWAPGRAPDEMTLAPLPRWIMVPIRGPRIGRSLSDWRCLVREGVAEGERNTTIASLTGHLLWHGVDPDVALELLLAWNRMRCRPPLDDAEVAQVVASIARLHEAEGATDKLG
jgi:Primase C terminal 1 (PriCT-1)/Bifunctional DNA primase/polymerase, N-terminal